MSNGITSDRGRSFVGCAGAHVVYSRIFRQPGLFELAGFAISRNHDTWWPHFAGELVPSTGTLASSGIDKVSFFFQFAPSSLPPIHNSDLAPGTIASMSAIIRQSRGLRRHSTDVIGSNFGSQVGESGHLLLLVDSTWPEEKRKCLQTSTTPHAADGNSSLHIMTR